MNNESKETTVLQLSLVAVGAVALRVFLIALAVVLVKFIGVPFVENVFNIDMSQQLTLLNATYLIVILRLLYV